MNKRSSIFFMILAAAPITAAYTDREFLNYLDQRLYEEGPDILNVEDDSCGEIPLICAAQNDHAKSAAFLIEEGADVDVQGVSGSTAIMYAAENGNDQIITMLYEADADLDAQDTSGHTALMRAASQGAHRTVEMLLLLGANRNILSNERKTAFDYAMMAGHEDVAALLETMEPVSEPEWEEI